MSTLTKQVVNTLESVLVISPDMYHLLKTFAKNRAICKLHVAKMKSSILKHGVLRYVIVVKYNNNFYIVDGQHLTEAIKELKWSIHCKVIECETEQDITQLMIDLNNTSKSWKLDDYIHSWAESGKKHYGQLRSDYKGAFSDIQVTVIMQAYSQKTRSKVTKMVKEGTFEIVNKLRGEELLGYIRELSYSLPNTRPMNEALIKLMLTVEAYNQKAMVKKIKSAIKDKFIFSTSEGKLYAQLLEIYNK